MLEYNKEFNITAQQVFNEIHAPIEEVYKELKQIHKEAHTTDYNDHGHPVDKTERLT